MAAYHDSDEVDTPLLRHSYPHLETHDAFRVSDARRGAVTRAGV